MRLFNHFGQYTELGRKTAREADKAVKIFIQEQIDKGIDATDLQHLMSTSVQLQVFGIVHKKMRSLQEEYKKRRQ